MIGGLFGHFPMASFVVIAFFGTRTLTTFEKPSAGEDSGFAFAFDRQHGYLTLSIQHP